MVHRLCPWLALLMLLLAPGALAEPEEPEEPGDPEEPEDPDGGDDDEKKGRMYVCWEHDGPHVQSRPCAKDHAENVDRGEPAKVATVDAAEKADGYDTSFGRLAML